MLAVPFSQIVTPSPPHAGPRRKEKHHAPFCTSSGLALWEANPSICEGVAATRGLFNLKRTS